MMDSLSGFCLGTLVPRQKPLSAGGVGMFIRTYVVHIVHNAHAQVMEAENSITLIYTSEQVFIALGWCSEMIGFS